MMHITYILPQNTMFTGKKLDNFFHSVEFLNSSKNEVNTQCDDVLPSISENN
jgi:hypothetical protein